MKKAANNLSLWEQFKGLSTLYKILIVSILIVGLGNILDKFDLDKPDVCKCNIVFQQEFPPVKIVEEIIGTDIKYVSGLTDNIQAPVEQARRECRLKWQEKIKAQYGSAFEGNEAERFFSNSCKK